MKKYEELGKRTVILLEKTKKKADKYGKERKLLDNYLRNIKDDQDYMKEWEEQLDELELELNKV